MTNKLLADLEQKLIIVKSERDDVIRAAARMAEALQDIYNELGNLKEINSIFSTIHRDVFCYKGLTKKGIDDD